MNECDILHENGKYWVCKAKSGYEVYKTGITHSTRCAIIGEGQAPNLGLTRAIHECDRRATSDTLAVVIEKVKP